jgi:hypothetical protein
MQFHAICDLFHALVLNSYLGIQHVKKAAPQAVVIYEAL